MPQYLITVTWEEMGQFVVTAPNLEAAIQAVENDDEDQFTTGDANGEYVDDSFKVNKDCCAELTSEQVKRNHSDDKHVVVKTPA